MSKYDVLQTFLEALPSDQDQVTLPFSKLEGILGFELPPSARKYEAWWANQEDLENRPHARAWIEAGFKGVLRSFKTSSPQVVFARTAWPHDEGFNPKIAFAYLDERYGLRKEPKVKMAGFLSAAGRPIALSRDEKRVFLYVESGEWELPGVFTRKVFQVSEPRHTGIKTHAPELAPGNPAARIEVENIAGLKAFCDLYDGIKQYDNVEEAVDVTARSIPLNQILYGPPGTGKTYATVNRALAILDPEYLAAHANERTALKHRFDELVADQRVRFVTFHQSFSYEDFVEGIRAKTVEGALVYREEPGVFKELCEDARSRVVQRSAEVIDPKGRRIWKMSLGNTQEDDDIFDDCRDSNLVLLGWGQDVDFSEARNRKGVLDAFEKQGREPRSDYEVTAVDMFRNRVREGDLVVVSDGNHKFRAIAEITGDYEFMPDLDHYEQGRRVKWHQIYSPSRPTVALMNNKIFSQRTIYELRAPSIDMEKLSKLLAESSTNEAQTTDAGNWVLIIDEINRGNVSRIFGELITLIEPNKRAGEPEALSTILPYSKEPFEVPSNVYLIGTMNTADRSLASLDIALRRRFVFEEVAPDPSVLKGVTVDGVAIDAMLHAMNERIEALLDRDHCLGHSYLLPLKSNPTLPGLRDIFRRQVVPLLQEYFFDDWRRIQWVLNDHRKADAHRFVTEREPDNSVFGEDDVAAARNGHWRLNETAFAHIESYRGIIRASE